MNPNKSTKDLSNSDRPEIRNSELEFISKFNDCGLYNIRHDVIKEGIMGIYDVSTDINVFYTRVSTSKSFSWVLEREVVACRNISFNYLLHIPTGMLTGIENLDVRELISNQALIVDATSNQTQNIILPADELFEVFRLEISETRFKQFVDEYAIPIDNHLILQIQNQIFDDMNIGVMQPIGAKEKICLADIVNSGLRHELHKVFVLQKINELMIYFFSKISILPSSSKFDEKLISIPEMEKLVKIKQDIDEKITEKLNLDSLGIRHDLSVESIKRGFYQLFGTDIAAYIRRQRLNIAYYTLLERGNNMRVKELAIDLKFRSTANFSRSFYNEFNVRPSAIQAIKENLKHEPSSF